MFLRRSLARLKKCSIMKTYLSSRLVILGLFLYTGFAYASSININTIISSAVTIKKVEYFKGDKVEVQYNLEGRFFNPEDNKPVPDVEVTVTNIKNNWLINLKTDNKGKFTCELHDASVYSVEGKKKQFFNAVTRNFSTVGRSKSEKIELELPIKKMNIGSPHLLNNISFELNDHTLTSNSTKGLKSVIELLQQNPNIIVEIGCHTDSRGNDIYNLGLSQKRANAIKNYLMGEGINELRVVAKGYGESRLTNKCSNGVRCKNEQHLINRRIEFKVIEFAD
jgi:outer membrane protein OmpA-like peptidoglycan-associated protein